RVIEPAPAVAKLPVAFPPATGGCRIASQVGRFDSGSDAGAAIAIQNLFHDLRSIEEFVQNLDQSGGWPVGMNAGRTMSVHTTHEQIADTAQLRFGPVVVAEALLQVAVQGD